MLHAIKHNKIPRGLFRKNEDSLTSAVFERLLYLPKELMHQIMVKSIYQTIPEFDIYSLESLEFWPSWNAADTTNSRRVEPDIFIRTTTIDIIIEAKRNNKKQQLVGQWKNQITAYKNEYAEDQKKMIYIALGGLHTTKVTEIECGDTKHFVYKCDWSNLLRSIKEVEQGLENTSNLSNTSQATFRIVQDLILCFSMYGFSTANWFDLFYKPKPFQYKTLKVLKTWKK